MSHKSDTAVRSSSPPDFVPRRIQVSIEQSSDFKGYMGLLSENVNPENKGDM